MKYFLHSPASACSANRTIVLVSSKMAAVASQAGIKRKRGDNIQNIPRKSRKNSSNDDDESATPENESAIETVKSANKHTKKERKSNRSSRIHSLKKLLARDTLPSNIRQEKERELAALEYDQAKHKSKKQDKKVLEKYHYVRFVERQKAEKRLKQLRKLLQDEEEEKKVELEKDIHEMEVNRNYAIYAPLHRKYVSVFVKSKGRNEEDVANITGKPSMWHEVEEAMHEGQSALEALRDGKRRTNTAGDVELQNADTVKSQTRKEPKKYGKIKAGVQRAEDRSASFVAADVSDDEMSDGGFFQR